MKYWKFFLISTLLAWVGSMYADDVSVANIEIMPDKSKTISINLNNTENAYVGFQMDLVLPDKVEIAEYGNGALMVNLCQERAKGHQLSVKKVSEHTYRLLAYSDTNETFLGTEGSIVDIAIKAGTSIWYGDYTASIVNPKFAVATGTKYELVDTTFLITYPKPITVTAKDATRLYGDDNPSFEYTVSGGTLRGEPELTCEATLLSPVGKYDIQVGRGSVTNENVVFKAGKLTVGKVSLTIKADDKQMKRGTPLPDFTATYTGFKNEETEMVLTQLPSFWCSASSHSQEGTYDITPYWAEAMNYEMTYEKGTLTIAPPDSIVVTAMSCSREYGEENPVFEYIVEGGTLDGEPRIYCNAHQHSDVGEYSINISRGSVTNRYVKYVNGTLTVTKAPLTIMADDKQMYEGDNLPEFTASYTGFKNGNSEYSLTKKPEFLCEATTTSSLGTYDITPCNAEGKNYEISYVKGKLTVNPVVTVRVKDCSRLYGDENPTFEYTVEGGVLEGEPSLSCNATKSSEVGTYTIKISKGGIKNPKVNLINGVLTVDKAPLIVSVGNYEIKVGRPLPKFEVSYNGFKSYDNTYVLERLPVVTCEASLSSEVGVYDIVVSGAEAKNYAFTYQNGTLTILPKVYVVIANSVAGGLDAQILADGHKKLGIDGLTITGLLNGTDIKTIREMLIGGDLSRLDLQDCSIVEGGDAYKNNYTVKNNVIGESFFENCKNLESIILPEGVYSIESFAFWGCHYLRHLSIPSSMAFLDGNSLLGCGYLDTIYCYVEDISEVKPYKGGNADNLLAFSNIAGNCIWHVVKGTKLKYTQMTWWKDFGGLWTIIDDLPSKIPDEIDTVHYLDHPNDGWYTLQGVSLNGKPKKQGIYIHNGRKVTVKDCPPSR